MSTIIMLHEEVGQFINNLASVVHTHKTVIRMNQCQFNTYPHNDPHKIRVVPFVKGSKLYGETLSVSLQLFLESFVKLLAVYQNVTVTPNESTDFYDYNVVAGTDRDWQKLVTAITESSEPKVDLNVRAELIDPVTHDPIFDKDAVYLESNVTRIARRAYKRQTLEGLLGTNPLNPMTGQPFASKDIKSFDSKILEQIRRR